MHSQSEDDILGFEMDGARGTQQQHLRFGDGFGSVTQPSDLDDRYDDDVTAPLDESDVGLPPLVSLQGRGPSQPMSMGHTQGITVSCGSLCFVNEQPGVLMHYEDRFLALSSHISGLGLTASTIREN